MNKECEIVQDLLFGYSDGTLTDTSKELVEKHLENCDICKSILEEIKNDKKSKNEKKEIDYLKKVKKKLNKKSVIITIVSILFIILIVFNILVYNTYKNIAEEMKIFLQEDATEEQLLEIENTVKNIDSGAQIEYVSKEQELANMKEKFKDKAYLLDGYEEGDNIFPESYIIKTDVKNIEIIEEKLQGKSYIKTIQTNTTINPYILFFAKNTINK